MSVNLDTFEKSPYPDIKMGKDGEPILVTPTTEQMISWLGAQEPIKEIPVYRYTRFSKRYWCYDIFDEKGYSLLTNEECFPNCGEGYSCRKEATLAAIDSALEYLINNKKIMEKYTIYCTKDQTKKAIELGAPIEKDWIPECLFNNDYFSLKNPTAEQMISWLEEQECISEIHIVRDISYANWCFEGYDKHYTYAFSSNMFYETRKEATLNAIDTALEYLINNQK